MTRKVFHLLFVMTLIIGLVLVSAPQPTRAAGPWYVSTTGNDANDCLSPATTCATVNGAIGKAAASGDTIKIAAGTYTGTGTEVVLINKSVTLSGGWNASFTTQSGTSTINGGGARRGVTVSSGVTTLVERLVLQNGLAPFAPVYATDVGGGLYNEGTLTLNNSIISGNTASSGFAGGILNGGNLTLNNSAISGNSAGQQGGGIRNDGSMTISRSSIRNNTAEFRGGILNIGTLILTESDVSRNVATSDEGGITNFGTLTLNSSTISGNDGSRQGGGLFNIGSMTLNNSTVSGNQAEMAGGIYSFTGSLILNNSTISGNTASSGGGIVDDSGTLSLQNSLIAANTASNGADCWSPSNAPGVIISLGHNLIGDTSNCDFTAATGDLTNIVPLLGPLQDNGGPTFTHALQPGSPAIDAGNPAVPGGGGNACLATDQRGVTRPQGLACDIGAFELEANGGVEVVTIDIKPGSQTNPINPKSLGTTPVAILSTLGLNAPSEVDKTSLTFGRTGDEASLVSCNKGGEDVSGDGLLDLVCRFKTKLTGFQIGDTVGTLKGQTVNGDPIEGQDKVKILK